MDLKIKNIACATVAVVFFVSLLLATSEARHRHSKCNLCPFTLRLDEDRTRNPRYIIRISCHNVNIGGRPCRNVTENIENIGTVVVGCKVQETQQIADTARASNH